MVSICVVDERAATNPETMEVETLFSAKRM
jgi:hypothetical protein